MSHLFFHKRIIIEQEITRNTPNPLRYEGLAFYAQMNASPKVNHLLDSIIILGISSFLCISQTISKRSRSFAPLPYLAAKQIIGLCLDQELDV